jgi:hypothetical protein
MHKAFVAFMIPHVSSGRTLVPLSHYSTECFSGITPKALILVNVEWAIMLILQD